MRFLLTGAGGFVGPHLVALLHERGHEVLPTSLHGGDLNGMTVESLDVTSPAQTVALITNYAPDAIVHLAAQASVRLSWEDPELTYRVNVLGVSSVLEAVRQRPSTKVLLVGSAQVYGDGTGFPLRESDSIDPQSPYAVSKATAEMIGRLYAKEFNLNVMMTRSFNHTGPGQDSEYAVGAFTTQLVSFERSGGGRLQVGNLDVIRDFLDVRDVITAYLLLLEKGSPGEIYNVSSGVGIRLRDILKMLLEASDTQSAIEVDESPQGRRGDPDLLIGDNSKLTELGWRQEISIEQSLTDTLEWCRKVDHGS